MPLFRLTFKEKDGQTRKIDLQARNFLEVFGLQEDIFHLITVERINRINGQVMTSSNKE